MDTKTLYTDLAENVAKGDLVSFSVNGEDFEGALLRDPLSEGATLPDEDHVLLTLSNEGDAGDAREVVLPWDFEVNVLGGDYDGIEVD